MTVDYIFDFLTGLLGGFLGSDYLLLASMLIPCLAIFGFITIYALIVIYAELKVSSFIQDKVGPMGQGVGLHAGKWGLLQPVADALKLLLKEDIIPSSADRPLFILAPFMIFIGAFISFVAIPFGESIIVADLNIGLFYILGVGSIAVLSLILAGWASNNKWSLYGGMRSAAQIVSYEIPAGLSLIVVMCTTLRFSAVFVSVSRCRFLNIAGRFGKPFFLSSSDDDAMLEILNSTTSARQNPCRHCDHGL